jgi:RNA ligase (TIGR02306 family)
MIGSHDTRRQIVDGEDMSVYQTPLTPQMKKALSQIKDAYRANVVIFYGEIFGDVQDLKYGMTKGQKSYLIYDLYIDGTYLPTDEVRYICKKHGLEFVPVLYIGPFSFDKMKQLADGPTTLVSKNPHTREGIVIRPIAERTDPEVGRVILKLHGDAYAGRKKGTEYK